MANLGLRVGSVTARYFLPNQISPAQIGANALSYETYTVNGLFTDMAMHVNQQVTQTGLVLLHARCSATNVLELVWWNSTGSPLTPTASQWVDVVGF